MTGERQPIIAEDTNGNGFACEEYYQIYLDESGAPLNSDADLMLDGGLRVAYARILELRKLNGKRRVPRLSVKAADASCCLAVVLPAADQGVGSVVARPDQGTSARPPRQPRAASSCDGGHGCASGHQGRSRIRINS